MTRKSSYTAKLPGQDGLYAYTAEEDAIWGELFRRQLKLLADVACREYLDGVIRKRVTLLDPGKLDLKLCVIAHVTLEDHHEEAVVSFASVVLERPEIMECYALSGAFDYMLKIRAKDVESYEAFMTRCLMRNPHVRTVVSSFVLRELKFSTELPI